MMRDEAKLNEIVRIMDSKFEVLKAIRIGTRGDWKTRPLTVIVQSCEERHVVAVGVGCMEGWLGVWKGTSGLHEMCKLESKSMIGMDT